MSLANNFGVLLPTRGVLVYAGSGGPRVELTWQMAETAERAGYDSVWVGDSITSKPRMEPLTAMAAIAARTSRVKVGTAVLLNALRHPVHLAHSAATIDNISAGRTILGLGAGRGNNRMFIDEHAAVGVPIEERAPRMEESIRVMRALWTGEPVTSDGEFYPLDNVMLEPGPGPTVHPAVDFQQLGSARPGAGCRAGRRLDYQRPVGGVVQPLLAKDRAERRRDGPRRIGHRPLPVHLGEPEG